MEKCPFEITKIVCLSCGEKLYNVDGQETRSSNPSDLTGFGLIAVAKYIIFGGRCDNCGSQVGYAPKNNSTK
jgi:DNA-directed RNA polymerase subunit RPC12/RpoP